MVERLADIDVLNDEILLHIFSFVGGRLTPSQRLSVSGESGSSTGKRKKTECVEFVEEEVSEEEAAKIISEKQIKKKDDKGFPLLEACRYYTQIASVCRSWKKLMDAFLGQLVTPVHVQLKFSGNEIQRQAKVESCISWICQRKLSIRSLVGVGQCAGLLPQAGNVTKESPDGVSNLLRLLNECDTSNLKELQILVFYNGAGFHREEGQAFHILSPRDFLDQLARQCPNLAIAELHLYLDLRRASIDDPALISSDFFSLASIETLRICIASVNPSCRLDGLLFSQMVRNLGNLQFLFLESVNAHLGDEVYHIQSASLQQILVEGFTKHINLSLDCPNLQVYRCKGFVSHNEPRQVALQQRVVRAENIPESCLGLVQHVCNPNGLPIGFSFHSLLGPQVQLLPLRRHHHA